MRHLLAAVSGLLMVTGCVGAVGGTDTGGDDGTDEPDAGTTINTMGATIYKRDVHAAMAKCSGGGCHSLDAVSGALGKFYTMDPDAGYAAIERAPTIVGGFTSIAPILTKITAGHQGVTYTPDESTKITNWLSVEATERKGTNPTPTVDPKAMLATWTGCMTLENFRAANMPGAWSTLAANNNQKCLNCHQGGGDGFMVNGNADVFFKVVSEQSGYLLKYFTVDTASEPAKVIINTGAMNNAGTVIVGHPRFNPTTNIGMTALQKFYDSTLAAQTAAGGNCGPAKLID
ncbi:MAG: hypothetical protein H0T89_08925 [Deltaproteobacteria bacterium]|nr:hypothetical protein [Deltaproteobacteria bacterium]MDQ3297365.1 hypothetical protein [Myxococcota bacterium]